MPSAQTVLVNQFILFSLAVDQPVVPLLAGWSPVAVGKSCLVQ